MITNGIKISWVGSQEYVPIPNDLKNLKEIKFTLEKWDGGGWVKWNTDSVIKTTKNGKIQIKIVYKKQANLEIFKKDKEVCFGESTFIIGVGEKKGHAEWRDFDDKKNNGRCSWKRITSLLVNNHRKKTQAFPFQRRQAAFKSLLLSMHSKCELTGTKTTSVLEAAHIIPVMHGGTECINNGIILRADIHRLYDNKEMLILADGSLKFKAGLEKSYLDMLKGKKLSSNTVDLVKEALTIMENKNR